jgi:hypothetical protein
MSYYSIYNSGIHSGHQEGEGKTFYDESLPLLGAHYEFQSYLYYSKTFYDESLLLLGAHYEFQSYIYYSKTFYDIV